MGVLYPPSAAGELGPTGPTGPTGSGGTGPTGPTGSGGGGEASAGVQNFAISDSYDVTAADTGKVFTNVGAGGFVEILLPNNPAANIIYGLKRVNAAQVLLATPTPSNQIIWSGGSPAAGTGLIINTDGGFFTLISNDDGNWLTIAEGGTLVENPPPV